MSGQGILLCTAFAVLAFTQQTKAQGMQDADALARLVRQTAQALAPPGASLSLGPVDGARAMPECTVPMTVTINGLPPYEQAQVQCPSPRWNLYVSVTVTQSEKVVVTALPVTAGQAITPEDVMLKTLPVQNFAGRQVFTDPAQIIGANAVMSLSAGMIVTQDSVQAPLLVKAGQMVTVHVFSGSVMLALDATADQAGRIGDTILLTNTSSGRRFSAEVTAQGVELHLN